MTGPLKELGQAFGQLRLLSLPRSFQMVWGRLALPFIKPVAVLFSAGTFRKYRRGILAVEQTFLFGPGFTRPWFSRAVRQRRKKRFPGQRRSRETTECAT